MDAWTNDRWLTELRPPAPSAQAVEDLRAYVHGTLARALRTRVGVGEADLDDFVQDALVRVLGSLDQFRGDSRFTTWAAAVAIHTALGALRSRGQRHVSLEVLESGSGVAEPHAPKDSEPGRGVEREELLDALRRSIEEDLTERQRIVVLGLLSGVPTEALVGRLGTNANALYKLYFDARKNLKRALEQAGYGDEDVRRALEGPPDAA